MTLQRYACVTGTDRGVGLALVKELLQAGYAVFAGGIARENAELEQLSKHYPNQVFAFHLDVGSDTSVKEAAAFITSKTDKLDLIINNAAVLGDTSRTIYDELDFDDMLRTVNINALGALRVSNALIKLVMAGGKLIVNISSEAGSIGQCYREGWFGYAMGKTALNMGSVTVHNRIRKEGGRVLVLHPGWVKTALSGTWNDEGTYTPEQSAAMIWKTIQTRGEALHEKPLYLEVDTGKLLPW